MQSFDIHPANTTFWNRDDFVKFLIDNQGQPINITTSGEGPCLNTIGVYQLLEHFKFQDVSIHTNNFLESHQIFKIKKTISTFLSVTNVNYDKFHNWNQSKIFGCFYNRPLWYRIGLATNLQYTHAHCSTVNVRCDPSNIDNRMLFETQQLFENHPDSFIKFSNVVNSWPIQLEPVDTYGFCNTTEHTDQLADFYPDFLIDIVAETWTSGTTFFPTEKTVRPMLLKKPFIIFGSRDYLDYLHQMGFKTFCNFWLEDYDGYEGQERYVRILALIDELAKKSKKELQELHQAMQPVLDHNYNLLQTQSYNKIITKII
jgi:hypothetical protein